MRTSHQIICQDAAHMAAVESESVDLVVTSPPYPMIAMWDAMFARQNPAVAGALAQHDGQKAFAAMHAVLDAVWDEVYRVLKPGRFVCINVGDATRTLNGDFGLYPNHMRILARMRAAGFSVLPCILWRKQTNAPNKFMGSGMLPAGAYVTLEHEYILIFRKGPKRAFGSVPEKINRHRSAIFWEERNRWYSDVWLDIKGTLQALNDKDGRRRSAAYPFEIAYRLINMYSVRGDVVLDPFWGTGTTTTAAMAGARNSIGYEIDQMLAAGFDRTCDTLVKASKLLVRRRLAGHIEFVVARTSTKGALKYINRPYGFPVMTAQEQELLLNDPLEVKKTETGRYEVAYDDAPQPEFCQDWDQVFKRGRSSPDPEEKIRQIQSGVNLAQLKMFT